MQFFDIQEVYRIFQTAVSTYDQASFFYREAGDRLVEQLEWMRITPVLWIDLGMGTGYITQQLQKKYPYAQGIGLDLAPAMLHYARAHSFEAAWWSICGEANRLPIQENTVDLVVSHLMLPWCNEVDVIFREFYRILKPGGLLLFSTFGPDTLQEVRASWAEVDENPHVHLFFDAHDLGDFLKYTGFLDPVMQTEWLTGLYPDINKLHQDLKQTGSTNILQNRSRNLLGRERYLRFLKAYAQYRHATGQWPVTFEFIYGHCWKTKE